MYRCFGDGRVSRMILDGDCIYKIYTGRRRVLIAKVWNHIRHERTRNTKAADQCHSRVQECLYRPPKRKNLFRRYYSRNSYK